MGRPVDERLGAGAWHHPLHHWFQPMTGATAEKHDAFINWDDQGSLSSPSGNQLIQGARRQLVSLRRPAHHFRGAWLHCLGSGQRRVHHERSARQDAVHPDCVYRLPRRGARSQRCRSCARWSTSGGRRREALKLLGNGDDGDAAVRSEQSTFSSMPVHKQRPDLMFANRTPGGSPPAQGAGAGGSLLRRHQGTRPALHAGPGAVPARDPCQDAA